MTKRSSSAARVLAAAALVCGIVAVIVVVATSLGGGDGHAGHRSRPGHVTRGNRDLPPVPAAYVVQNGDTLISIAHKTGVSVARIQALNPSVDPQILISGQKLKLR
ncbi:MAG: LysM domain-containing protein [Solirubrobacterales bacterium]